MPELPEVETTRRGIAPHLQDQIIESLVIRNRRLRWPIEDGLEQKVAGQIIDAVERRAKYLLIRLGNGGHLILHLGMSGSVRVLPRKTAPDKHDHVDLILRSGQMLRLNDPRRFGSLHWQLGKASEHWLIKALGPEPLSDEFHAEHLFRHSRKRKVAIKNFLMDNHIVVGVGNIYASESLFRAGIQPNRPAGRISRQRYQRLCAVVKDVLGEAITAGGTTLRDFEQPSGKPGYFQIQLSVYGRAGQPCPNCGKAIRQQIIGQRNSFFCAHCQT